METTIIAGRTISFTLSLLLFSGTLFPLKAASQDTRPIPTTCEHMIGQEGRAAGNYDRGDFNVAFQVYSNLVNCGDRVGQYHLGQMYELGQGTQQDYFKAHDLFILAAKQEDGRAQLELGKMYHDGRGSLQDFVHSHMWFNLAIVAFHDDPVFKTEIATAIADRDQVASEMTPAQISRAQEMAKRCLESNYAQCD